jgi:recombination protein RecT
MTKVENKAGASSATNEVPDTDKPSTAIQKSGPTHSERFTAMVMKQFSGVAGTVELTGYQKRLIQNYFISTDMALKAAEEKRLKKSEKFRDATPLTWENVNLEQLAMDVVACSKIGYDPALPNHISMIPYKNNKIGNYNIGFIEGYRGKELKARKYGFQIPDNVIVELVYAKDSFKPLKKDIGHDVESFEFSVSENPFDRGEIIGGFYYHEYYEEPRKNKLMFYSTYEIEKRKPEYASPEFWGGEKDKWEDGKKVGKEKVEGWYPEMMWKTLFRMAYGVIPIDSEKIDDNLMRMLEQEKSLEALRDQDPDEALKERRDSQLQQGTGTKSLKTSEVPGGDAARKTIGTDIQYEEVNDNTLPENGQGQPAETLFGTEAAAAQPGF